ncbi:MAG: acetylxylan esterase [Bryobacteraceae bacterium]|nr:acetylxylan esterase [Bryobacteraceae bacterium]
MAAQVFVAGLQGEAAPAEMLRGYLTGLAKQQLAARREKIAGIRTRGDVETRQTEVRRTLLKFIGGLPDQKTQLNVRTTGTLERNDYRVDKIIFESQPGLYVTANLYVPRTGTSPYPAILHPPGHSVGAKTTSFYQGISLALVKSGFVVLVYDPVDQGERRIFYDSELADSKVGGTTTEHQMVGVQALLAGESIARTMVWDGMRALDVLESLPFVDAKRLGITGCSGGGTLTAYLAALDPRLQVAAPACYISSWEEQLDGTGPQDAEQQFPDQLKNGINHGDFVQAFAPKPYLICSTTDDFFPLKGSQRTFEESRRVYALFGAEERISTFVAPGRHGVPPEQLRAISDWMVRWLKPDRDSYAGPPPRTEFEEDLYATRTGQLATSLAGETASTLNLKRFGGVLPERKVLGSAREVEQLRARLRQEIIALTRYEPPRGPLAVHIVRVSEREGITRTELMYEPAPGRRVPALLAIPPKNRRGVVLYLHDRGRKTGVADIEELVRNGYAVLAPDVSGFGETATKRGSYSEAWFGQDKITWLALMVGKPLTGIRMEDISRALDLLAERGLLDGGRCIGFGVGAAATDLLHAAVMDERIGGQVLERGLVSFQAIARTPIQRGIFETVVPGVLGRYDFPDLVAAMAPRSVWLASPQSPMGHAVAQADVRREYDYAIDAYEAAGTAERLVFSRRRQGEELMSAYPSLR